jgi:hypothetical protein
MLTKTSADSPAITTDITYYECKDQLTEHQYASVDDDTGVTILIFTIARENLNPFT